MIIGVGIIGLSAKASSWTASAHIVPLQQHSSLSSKYKLTAIATSSPSTALKSAEKWGLQADKAYNSPEEIAHDPDVALVVVGVKLPMHRDLALPALKAGKDVFVEWPLAIGDQIPELLAAAKEGGGRTVVGLQARCSPTILKAKEIIDSADLGRIISTDLVGIDNRTLSVPPSYYYIHDSKNHANLTTIAAAHTLDAICFLLGEFKYLTAQARCSFPTVTTPHDPNPVIRDAYDDLAVQGVLESGAALNFHMFGTTSATPNSLTWTIIGEKGALKFEGDMINIQMVAPKMYCLQGEESSGEWKEVQVDAPMAYGQIGEVYDAFINGEKVKGSLVDFEGAALRHRMLDACFKSSRDGTRETYV